MFVLQLSTSVYTSCRNKATWIAMTTMIFPILRKSLDLSWVCYQPYSKELTLSIHHILLAFAISITDLAIAIIAATFVTILANFSNSPSIFEESSCHEYYEFLTILFPIWQLLYNLTLFLTINVFPSDTPFGSPSRRYVRVIDGNVGFMTVGISTKLFPHLFQESSSACCRCHFSYELPQDSSWGAVLFSLWGSFELLLSQPDRMYSNVFEVSSFWSFLHLALIPKLRFDGPAVG